MALYPLALAETALQHAAGVLIAAARVHQWTELPEAPPPAGAALVRGLAFGTLVLCCLALGCEARSLISLRWRAGAAETPQPPRVPDEASGGRGERDGDGGVV